MNPYALLSLSKGATAILAGGFVYSKQPSSALNRLFLLNALTVGYLSVIEFAHRQVESVARHASTREVALAAWTDDDCVGISIDDRGDGFDPGVVRSDFSSAGIQGIRERIDLLGGELDVESAPGRRTRLRAELPLELVSEAEE